MSVFSMIAAVTLAFPMLPLISWYESPVTVVFHARYPKIRRYSVMAMTDRNMKWTSWYAWDRRACLIANQVSTPDGLALIGAGASLFGKPQLSSVVTAAVGCQMIPPCVSNMNMRCNSYMTMKYASIVSLVMWSTAIIGMLCFPCCLMCERKAKEKKKHSAIVRTMVCCGVNLFFAAVGVFSFLIGFSSFISSMNAGGYWPPPKKSGGVFLSIPACVLPFIVVLLQLTKLVPKIDLFSKDDEGDIYCGAGMQPGGMLMGPGAGMPMAGNMQAEGAQVYGGAPPIQVSAAPQMTTPYGAQF